MVDDPLPRLRRQTGPKCSVCVAMKERGPEWAEKFRAILANPKYPYASIAEVLRSDPEEPDLSPWMLGYHSRGDCAAHDRVRPL